MDITSLFGNMQIVLKAESRGLGFAHILESHNHVIHIDARVLIMEFGMP